jgi:hypothetical protein
MRKIRDLFIIVALLSAFLLTAAPAKACGLVGNSLAFGGAFRSGFAGGFFNPGFVGGFSAAPTCGLSAGFVPGFSAGLGFGAVDPFFATNSAFLPFGGAYGLGGFGRSGVIGGRFRGGPFRGVGLLSGRAAFRAAGLLGGRAAFRGRLRR